MIEIMVVTLESSYIHGYHVYCNIWDVTIGEDLLCDREPSNEWDGYVVVVIKVIWRLLEMNYKPHHR